jgi:DNA-directed RNA polymerase subunit M/transcription elongation factor TFIIS
MDKFCHKCRIVLQPKEENDEVILECKNCGHREKFGDWVVHTCARCHHERAIVLYHAMTRGDEGTTTIYKCLNCGEADKDGYKGG